MFVDDTKLDPIYDQICFDGSAETKRQNKPPRTCMVFSIKHKGDAEHLNYSFFFEIEIKALPCKKIPPFK